MDYAHAADTDPGRWAPDRPPAREAWPAEAPPPAPMIVLDPRPTILLAGPTGNLGALAAWAERAGLRCVGEIGLGEVSARLTRTVSLDLILVDLRGDEARNGLDRATARAIAGRHGLIGTRLAVLSDLTGIDLAMAWLDAPDSEFLCEPQPSDIVTMLVMAGLNPKGQGHGPQLHDATRETEGARIERLSDEVRRLAATIERLTQNASARQAGDTVMEARGAYRAGGAMAAVMSPQERFRPIETPAAPLPGKDGQPTHGEIRALLRARRLREQFLPAELFADPAWDMILDLLAARLAGQRVSVSSLCIAAAVPPTTALRWIRQLTERAVFARIDDPADGRRVFIELTDDATAAMIGWTRAVRRTGGLLCGASLR